MKILITGAAGFIGSHLTEELLKTDNKIIAVDNFDEYYSLDIKCRNVLESIVKKEKINFITSLKTREEKIKHLVLNSSNENYKLYYCDIRNKNELEKIFEKERPEFIINLAGLAGVRPSLEKPLEYEEINVRGTMNILEICKKLGIKKFIQASSSSVYGNNKKAPFKETDIVDFAISPYAATKKSCEVIGHVYYKLYNIDMFQLRFFTVYGERQRPDLAIYKFTKMILEGEKIPFYGDGNTFRDYTYIKDIIHGIQKSIDYLKSNSNVYEIVNLGESHVVSLKEMVEVIENALGIKAKIDKLPMQMGDVEKTYADINKAKALIGYNPSTEFKDGIVKFIDWFKNLNKDQRRI